jgi:hypothetical protein
MVVFLSPYQKICFIHQLSSLTEIALEKENPNYFILNQVN